MGTRRRILHVITGLDVGGAEVNLVQLVLRGGLAEASAVVSLVPGGAFAPVLREHGIRLTELNLRTPVGFVAGMARLAGEINDFAPDLVQGWMYHGNLAALAGLALSRQRGRAKLAWTIRCADMDFSRSGAGLRAAVRLSALLSRRPDIVITNSVAGMDFHRRIGFRPRREAVVFNGIDVARFRPDPNDRAAVRNELGLSEGRIVVAHVARVDPMKGHDHFLAAMRTLPGIDALLIGRGTETLATPPNIRALGQRDDVPRLLRGCDLIVSSSLSEGFPNAVAEGMATGLPAVATDVGDTAEILGDTGLVVPPGDAAALADAIRRLSDEPAAEQQARGAAARERIATRFSYERFATELDRIYAALLEEKVTP